MTCPMWHVVVDDTIDTEVQHEFGPVFGLGWSVNTGLGNLGCVLLQRDETSIGSM